MTDSHSITQWIEGLKAGDDDAAAHLWDQYFERLVRFAKGRLRNVRIKKAEDEEDVAVSVFESLCAGAKEGRFDRLSTRNDLWPLLVAIARCKAANLKRRAYRKKRGAGEVRGESVFAEIENDSLAGGIDQFAIEEITPDFSIALNESFADLLESLNDESTRKVALMRLEGYSNEEIADSVAISVSSVERKLRLVRKTWSRTLDSATRS